MFGWVRALGCSRAAALVAGIAYGLAPFLVSFVRDGHDGKIFVITLAPLLFWTAERTFVRGGLLPYVLVALVIALVILTTHFQMAYFLFGGVGLFYLFRVWQLWRGSGEEATGPSRPAGPRPALTRLALFLTAAVAGAAVAGVQLLPAVDYVTQHSRRTATTVSATPEENLEYSSSFALHPEELVSYVVPEFPGNGAGGAAWASETYWGRNPLKSNHESAGLVVLLLAGLSFFAGARKPLRLFLLSLGLLAILFGLGRHTPVWRIFYELVPGVGLFRAPAQASFLFGFGVVTLAAFGVDRLLAESTGAVDEASSRRAQRFLWIAAALLGAGMLLAATGALFSLWTSVVYRSIDPTRLQALEGARPFIVRGFFVAALLSAATAATFWALRRGWLKANGAVAVLSLMVALDALRVDGAFVFTLQEWGVHYRQWSAPDANLSYLMERRDEGEPFRYAPIDDVQGVRPAMFGLELATGHHPNDLARYRELIGMRGSGFPENLANLSEPAPGAAPPGGPANVLRLLNVRYMSLPGLLDEASAAQYGWAPLSPRPVSQLQLGGQPQVIYELDALPRARLVAEAVVVPDDEAVARILDPAFDPARTAVLAEAPPVDLPGGAASGEVTWIERGINRMSLRVRSEGPALLVLADNWFPSWRARVNGAEAPVLRAYHALRAVPVGAGEQTVELYYDSPLLRTSSTVSVVALALLVVVGGVSLFRSRRGAAGPAAA
jgi:hypothetical protein